MRSVLTIDDFSLEITSGVACALSKVVSDGVLHLRPFSITEDGWLSTIDAPRIPRSAVPANKSRFEVGDILFNNTNSAELVGKSAVFSTALDASFSNHMTRIRVDPRRAEPGYVHAFLRHLYNLRFFQDRATRWVSQAAFGTSQLKALEVSLPPLYEQRRIVSLLDRAAAIRRRADAARAKSRAIIPALFLDMFGDPAVNPKGWPSVRFGNVISKIGGGKNIEAGNGSSDYRILKVSSVTSGQFIPDEAKPAPDNYSPPDEHRIKAGDFLFSRANTSELVGAVAIAEKDHLNLLLPDKIWRMTWDNRVIHPRFAYSLLRSDALRAQFAKVASGTSDSMKNISQAKLVEIIVPLPPLPLQTIFAEQALRINATSRALDAAAAKAEAMAAALSAEVFDSSATH